MGEIQLGIYDTRYDDAEPLYLTTEQGVRVWDRVKHRWLNWESLVAKASAEGHTWQNREVGIPSLMWQLGNSLATGQRWAPGLDDTSGLTSEQVSNGEDFTGASGATPPTGWIAGGTTPAYQLFGGVVGIGNNGSEQTMTQNLTGLTPGATYVFETSVHMDSHGDCFAIYEGMVFPLKPPTIEGDEFKLVAFSFTAADDGTAQIGVGCGVGGYIAVSFIRVYLESELTGS